MRRNEDVRASDLVREKRPRSCAAADKNVAGADTDVTCISCLGMNCSDMLSGVILAAAENQRQEALASTPCSARPSATSSAVAQAHAGCGALAVSERHMNEAAAEAAGGTVPAAAPGGRG